MDLSEIDIDIEVSTGATVSTSELIDGTDVIFTVNC